MTNDDLPITSDAPFFLMEGILSGLEKIDAHGFGPKELHEALLYGCLCLLGHLDTTTDLLRGDIHEIWRQ